MVKHLCISEEINKHAIVRYSSLYLCLFYLPVPFLVSATVLDKAGFGSHIV